MRAYLLVATACLVSSACSEQRGLDDAGAGDRGFVPDSALLDADVPDADVDVPDADVVVPDAGMPDAADGGGPPPTGPLGCLEVDADRQVDFTLQASLPFDLSFLLNGATPPDGIAGRGAFSLVHPVWGSGDVKQVPNGPLASARVYGIPGSHRVQFCGVGCIAPTTDPYCTCTETQIELTGAPVELGFDASPVELTLTLDGQPWPEAPAIRGAGRVVLEPLPIGGGRVILMDLPSVGPARVQVGAFPGTYRVTVQQGTSCWDTSTLCGNVDLGEIEVAGSSPVRRTFDLPSVIFEGRVTAQGAALSGQPGLPFGALVLTPLARTGLGNSVTLDETGSYRARILAGTYRLGYFGYQNPNGGTPRGRSVLLDPLDLLADRTLDVDLNPDTVRLSATVKGAALSESTAGGLNLLAADMTVMIGMPLSEFVNGRWSASLLEGTRHIEFRPPGNCDVNGNLPCQATILARDVDPSQALTVDIVSHPVTFEVAVNGQALPDLPEGRGKILMWSLDTSQPYWGYYPLPATGPAVFGTRLSPGRYGLALQRISLQACREGALAPLPCAERVELGEVEISGPGHMTLALSTARVAGQVSVGQSAVVLSPGSSAKLVFRTQDGAEYDARLGPDGAYGVWLPRTSYEARYTPGTACEGPPPSDPRSCAPQVLHGCAE